ncbi:NAD(P)/FAD-dependent oxidoreductase [Sphingoaurantiacus capsulatus]|uniref:NAD(P)/FAD-dependent oxidoreductase n=1 Tax=Sphingoaurantiacus capsulatus TaxID=1771310 RepID=A0ABV7X5I5_9SPHN
MDCFDVVIVGGGQAGAQAAVSLRQLGFAGTVAIIGEEPVPPYERPPLSKEYLGGEKSFGRLLLRPDAFWRDRDITLRLGRRVEAVDPAAHHVWTDDGTTIGYGQLVWAAGGYPRPLPIIGAELPGVHMIRTAAQVDPLRAEVAAAASVVVIGGGYIGLESAAVLAKQGKRVTVIEAQERVLARVAGGPISRFFEAEHRARGVDVRTGTGVTYLREAAGRVSHAVLGSGEEIAADVVIAGIGLIPAQAVLAEAGADCANGVVVDALCRTTLSDIFAIGDCALHPNVYAGGERVRIESVQNAIDQAKTVAGVIVGQPGPYRAFPWFWSHQYDLKLQTAGLNHRYDATVLRGDPASRSFSLIYLRAGRVVAVDAVNSIKDFTGGKALVEAMAVANAGRLRDVSVPLKEMG